MHVQVCTLNFIVRVGMYTKMIIHLVVTCSGDDPLPIHPGAHSLCLFLHPCHLLDVSRHSPPHSDPATVCSCPGA